MQFTRSVVGVCLALVCGNSGGAELPTRWRRPIAIQVSADEQTLLAANQRSGTLSVVNLAQGEVTAEVPLGERLSALQLTADGRWLLATDEARHELIRCTVSGEQIGPPERLAVSRYPVAVAAARDGRRAYVTSLWSRRLTAITLPEDAKSSLQVAGTLDLDFSPRCLLLTKDDTRLIVADAFGGRLAVVDPVAMRLLHTRQFPSHNIRGLATSPDGRKLLIVHQMLNELAHTTNNDVHWGLLMSNDLRWLPLDSVLSANADLYQGAHMHPLGHAGNATGDPSGLAVTAAGTVVVTMGGVDEMAIGVENDFSLDRVGVGRRPTAIVASPDGRRAYVANTLADTVSVVDLKERAALRELRLGPTPEPTLEDRGEFLFYDARLSHDGWMSCHSCHTDGHSNGLLNDNFSDGSFGAPKRVLSLAGQTDTSPFAWNAKVTSLEAQIQNSVVNTMQGDEPATDRQVTAMAAYIRTLTLPPPLAVARDKRDPAAEERGHQLFRDLRCERCHAPPTYTTAKTYDVGLHDKQGNKQFNPPSLRSVSQRGPYFHDNRAQTLRSIFQDHGHQLDRELAPRELDDLVAFLEQL